MNLTELRKELAIKSGITQEKAKEVIESLEEIIIANVQDHEEVVLGSLGKFVVKETAERQGVNPQTKQPLTIPAGHKVSFKAGKKLKDSVK